MLVNIWRGTKPVLPTAVSARHIVEAVKSGNEYPVNCLCADDKGILRKAHFYVLKQHNGGTDGRVTMRVGRCAKCLKPGEKPYAFKPRTARVASETTKGVEYLVTKTGAHYSCTCPSYQFSKSAPKICKHILSQLWIGGK